MTSKTNQLKMIRKHKKRAHKANRKADQKRIMRNYAVIHGQPAAENDVPATPAV